MTLFLLFVAVITGGRATTTLLRGVVTARFGIGGGDDLGTALFSVFLITLFFERFRGIAARFAKKNPHVCFLGSTRFNFALSTTDLDRAVR